MSADKIQLTLQKLLEGHLPLLHKGIFSEEEVRTMMITREKHERSMLMPTHNLTSFLSAIEYQYSLERLRRHRVAEYGSTNPLFLKHSKTDFIIIKRIIQLWNRTTHTYKYRQDLWKQYLQFTIAINSKKHFYKALTNSLRFLSHSEDLWEIAVRYQIEIEKNMWKARRMFIKSLKTNKQSIKLWTHFIEFQFDFVKNLLERESIIAKGEQLEGCKIITGRQSQQQQQSIDDNNQSSENDHNILSIDNSKLDAYDEIIWLIIQQSFNKINTITKQTIISHFIENITKIQKAQQNDKVITMMKRVLNKLKQLLPQNAFSTKHQPQISKAIHNHNIISYQEMKNTKPPINKDQLYQYYIQWLEIFKTQNIFQSNIIIQAIKSFILKPSILDKLVARSMDVDFNKTILILIQNLPKINLHTEAIKFMASQQVQNSQIRKYIEKQINNVPISQLVHNHMLLKLVINYNNNNDLVKQNCNLYRSIAINYERNHPQLVELCATLIKNK